MDDIARLIWLDRKLSSHWISRKKKVKYTKEYKMLKKYLEDCLGWKFVSGIIIGANCFMK